MHLTKYPVRIWIDEVKAALMTKPLNEQSKEYISIEEHNAKLIEARQDAYLEGLSDGEENQAVDNE